jgi:hypothetical protein
MKDDAEHYCQNCFALIAAKIDICPLCGGSVTMLSAQAYREKLLHALMHPLDDVRIRAIIVLGLRRETAADMPLAECALQHPLNIEEGIEVVNALAYIYFSSGQLSALELLAEQHPAHAVQVAARRILKEIAIQ